MNKEQEMPIQAYHKKSAIKLFFIGVCMGIADLIPGVSGGTIAFISGIYDRFIFSIKTVSNSSLTLFLKGRIKEAFSIIPFGFLIPLFAGILLAVFSMANVFSYLLDNYSSFVFSFFFGLVFASIFIVIKSIHKYSHGILFSFIVGVVLGWVVTGLIPVQTPHTPVLIFLSGAIAITAMILPGISGSFLLIIMGKYEQILQAVVDRDIVTLAIFIVGIVVGLALFSRFVNYFLRHHHNVSIAVLSGMMLGSIRAIWPWKEGMNADVKNVLPTDFSTPVILSLALMAFGVILVFYANKFLSKKGEEDPMAM
jgi:putative membrane protein